MTNGEATGRKLTPRQRLRAALNYFEVAPHQAAYALRVSPRQFTWRGLRDASFLLTCLSAVASVLAWLRPDTFAPYPRIAAGVFAAVLVLAAVAVYGSQRVLRKERAMSERCRKAPHLLRQMLDAMRAAVEPGRADGGVPAPPTREHVYEVLVTVLTGVAGVFAELVEGGSIAVGLLPPVCDEAGTMTLQSALWSLPYDDATRAWRHERDGTHRQSTYVVGPGISGRTLYFGMSVLVRNTAHHIPIHETHPFKFARSLISVPVLTNERTDMVMTVACNQPDQFHRHYIDVARAGASLIAVYLKLSGFNELLQ